MNSLIDQFIETLNSKSSKKAYKLSLNRFADYFSPQKLSKLNELDIENYLDNLKTRTGKQVKASSYNRNMNAIKSFYLWCAETQDTKINITNLKNKNVRKTAKKQYTISKEVFKKILTNTKTVRDKLLFTLMYQAGLRVSEILDLTAADINSKHIHIKGPYQRVINSSKNIYQLFTQYQKEERFYVAELHNLLQSSKQDLALFVSEVTGKPIKYHNMNLKFKQASVNFTNPDKTKLSLNQLRYSWLGS